MEKNVSWCAQGQMKPTLILALTMWHDVGHDVMVAWTQNPNL